MQEQDDNDDDDDDDDVDDFCHVIRTNSVESSMVIRAGRRQSCA